MMYAIQARDALLTEYSLASLWSQAEPRITRKKSVSKSKRKMIKLSQRKNCK